MTSKRNGSEQRQFREGALNHRKGLSVTQSGKPVSNYKDLRDANREGWIAMQDFILLMEIYNEDLRVDTVEDVV